MSLILGITLVVGLVTWLFWRVPKQRSICEIQGPGLVSPYLNRQVITSGIVSHSEGEGFGFALLDSTCHPEKGASRGILVSMDGGETLVQVGDEVRVRGVVQEVEGETRLLASPDSIEILNLGNQLPEPEILSITTTTAGDLFYESWEGQLITISQGNIQISSNQNDEITLIPRFDLDSSLDLVCFRGDEISLRLSIGGIDIHPDEIRAGTALIGLTGLLRQDQAGYWLDLIREPVRAADHLMALADEFHDSSVPSSTPSGQLIIGDPVVLETSTVIPPPLFTPSSTVIPSPTYYPIQLLITEILPNPSGEEPGGEWVEIYNPAMKSLPLDGIKFGDEDSPSGKEGMLRFPDGYRIKGQGILVIANQSRVFEMTYGFPPDFELVDSDPKVPDLLPYPLWGGSSIQLSNGADEVLLVNPWDQIIDLVVYGSSSCGSFGEPIPAPKEGSSLERYPPEQDSNHKGDWRERAQPSPGWLDRTPSTPALSYTPTASHTNQPEPSPAVSSTEEIVYTESATFTSSPSVEAFTATMTITPDPTVSQPPVFSRTPSLTLTPQPVHTSTPTTTFTPSGSATGTLPASPVKTSPAVPTMVVSFTPGVTGSPTTFSSPTSTPGPSKTSTPLFTGTIPASASPAISTPTPSPETTIPGPTKSPTATAVPTLTTLPAIVINEIHADPDPDLGDGNGDGLVNWMEDEFLELVNISEVDLVLDGWEVHDEVRLRFTFPENATLKAGCGLLVFGGGSPQGFFGGSQVFTSSGLGLNNAGDKVTIKDSDGEEITSCRYGSEGGQDQSLTRNPDLYGADPLVLHSLVPEANSELFSPGLRVDGAPFGDCP